MTVSGWLHKNSIALSHSGIESARLDCLILLEDALGQNRAHLLAHPETKIPKTTEVKLNNKIAQRCKHLPLAYIRGKVNFYGRQFLVNRHVLTPRPETEAMIELLKALKLPAKSVIIDIGTGSGCIAITAKLELPELEVQATDISENSLKMARKNAAVLEADVFFKKSDLLKSLQTTTRKLPTTILANLPYVPDRYYINEAAGFEPAQAIFAGDDGLDVYRRFWQQIAELKHKPEYVIAESLPDQHIDMAALAKKSGYRLQKTKDFAQLFIL